MSMSGTVCRDTSNYCLTLLSLFFVQLSVLFDSFVVVFGSLFDRELGFPLKVSESDSVSMWDTLYRAFFTCCLYFSPCIYLFPRLAM